jgi:hypothetical protein
MKATVFKDWYKTAAAENVETSDLFNCAGFFWLGLTDKQHAKMCQLLELQHCKVVDVEGEKWFQLQNGLRIKSV